MAKEYNSTHKPGIESEYDRQAAAFVAETGLTIEKIYIGHRTYSEGDEEQRAVWEITFEREGRKPYTFTYGDSLVDSYDLLDMRDGSMIPKKLPKQHPYWQVKGIKEAYRRGGGEFQGLRLRPAKVSPTDYDILSCLDPYVPETFEEFCTEFGHDTDPRKALRTYRAVQEQATRSLRRMFGEEELARLAEIQ